MLERPVTAQFSAAPLQLARLAPPPEPAGALARLRVDALLAGAAEAPLTLVVAPAGAGKTVALARLARRGGWPAAWLRAQAGDTPARLARHLAAALAGLPGAAPEPAPDLPDGAGLAAALAALDHALNRLGQLPDDALLVVDDYQRADDDPELRALVERLSEGLPPRLHLVLATRHAPLLAAARRPGAALRVSQGDLAMTLDEARALIGAGPAAGLAQAHAEARGLPLALHAMARAGAGALPAAAVGEFFAQEVLGELEPPLRALLLSAAALRPEDSADPQAWAALAPEGAPPGLPEELARRVLFTEPGPEGRPVLQPLFARFLRDAARAEDLGGAHARLARHCAARGDDAGAMHHMLAAGEPARAADLLRRAGPAWLESGRAEALLAWCARLPAPERDGPAVLLLAGAASRRLGRFDEALAAFARAEAAAARQGDPVARSAALRGQAEVFLDTVQPAQADGLLRQALKLLPAAERAERARLLRMLAENWTNRGRADVALRLERAAGRIARAEPPRPLAHQPEGDLPPRLLLRAGRLGEARARLEAELGLAPGQPAGELLHREPQLLLALIDAMLGAGARALAMARRGLLEAQRDGSRLTEAIANMRLGHAFQLVAPRDGAALAHYGRALALIEAAGVARTRAEAALGLTLIHSHAGDLAAAQEAARAGLAVAEAAGDGWIAALIWLALAGGAVAAGHPQAEAWLAEARQRALRTGDTYGAAVGGLWAALADLRAGRLAAADRELAELLRLCERHGYAALLCGPTLLGPRDPAALVPLLLRARAAKAGAPDLAADYLRHAFPAIAADELVETYHPGFTLRVQMLGAFRVWRGNAEVASREWQREKSRQLLQILLSQRGQWVQREQICGWLWPESDSVAAERQFKVTLNALNVALEPARPPRTPPFFIRRQGLAYSFAPSYGCWVDVDEFDLRLDGPPQGDPDLALRSAVAAVRLYQGDYLPELLYEPWTLEERERLLARFLAAAADVAARLLERGEPAEAIAYCEQVVRRDRCYEEAYQLLMRAHARLGSRSQAARAYARCRQALQDELAVEPLPETTALYERIRLGGPEPAP